MTDLFLLLTLQRSRDLRLFRCGWTYHLILSPVRPLLMLRLILQSHSERQTCDDILVRERFTLRLPSTYLVLLVATAPLVGGMSASLQLQHAGVQVAAPHTTNNMKVVCSWPRHIRTLDVVKSCESTLSVICF
jgi:hypothetical protein